MYNINKLSSSKVSEARQVQTSGRYNKLFMDKYVKPSNFSLAYSTIYVMILFVYYIVLFGIKNLKPSLNYMYLSNKYYVC